jgi:hypothetical protein
MAKPPQAVGQAVNTGERSAPLDRVERGRREDGDYRPLNLGGRFSMKARVPSR